MTDTTFEKLGLPASIAAALTRDGFTTPTPIQQQAIPPQLSGRDILGIAQTGSGKTAAFGLPILAALGELQGRPAPMTARALILAPTRELAVQIDTVLRGFAAGSRVTTALVLGGVSRGAQIQKLARGVDILVATPGRLKDLMDDRKLKLDQTRFLVLDEADRMLDMGFIKPVRAIAAACARDRRTALFSATMPKEVAELAASLLRDPVRVEVAPQSTTVPAIEQSVVHVPTAGKRAHLAALLGDPALARVIVFARTKHGADKVAKNLNADGFTVAAIHGNKSQNARQAALNGFRDGRVRVLVATDIAARGIDVPEISHVINYDLPDEAETYVHRIGRTGRNGASGVAITLCDAGERDKLRQVEKLIRRGLAASGDAHAAPAERSTAARTERPAGRKPEGRKTEGRKAEGRKTGAPRSGKPVFSDKPRRQPGTRVAATPAGEGKPWWASLDAANDGEGANAGRRSRARRGGRRQSARV